MDSVKPPETPYPYEPVVYAPDDVPLIVMNDSKKMSKKKLQLLFLLLFVVCIIFLFLVVYLQD